MNPREIAEIKRRLNPDKAFPTIIRGMYTTDDGQIISEFTLDPGRLSQDENEKYMSLFKKVLSGTQGQNLLPVEFTTDEVMNGVTHPLLMDVLSTTLKDEGALTPLYERILAFIQAERTKNAESVTERQNAANWLVLMLHDGYDIPGRDINGDIDRENAANVLHYILCCVCPVKQSKQNLCYSAGTGEFHTPPADWAACAPELGFMFPAYEEGGANIYRAMYYTKDAADLHPAFIENVFSTQLQMTAQEQQATFQTILSETLEEDCSLETVQAVHEAITEMIT